MPNKQKKRRLHHGSSSSSSSSSDQVVVAASLAPPASNYQLEDSIESCLAEMSAPLLSTTTSSSVQQPAATPVANAASISTESQQPHSSKTDFCDPTLTAPYPRSRGHRDRIVAWNRAMRLWQKTGKYTAGLLPSFDVEVTRHFKVQALSSFLLESCDQLKMPAFERWLIDSKLEERERQGGSAAGGSNINSDPVLCADATVAYESSQRLLEEIRETGIARPQAKRLVQDLCRRTQTAVREMHHQHAMGSSRLPLKKGDRIDLEGRAPVLTLVYHRKKQWAKPFCIKLNSTHYDKLRDMFERVHRQCDNDDNESSFLRWTEVGKPTKLTHAFHEILMVLLLRYSSLSGGQLLMDMRGGGMQGAIHGEVFRVLAECFPHGPLLEAFGSPLNAYLPMSFGSAFPEDLDWHFGSIGSFLDITVAEGCCEANPPFSPGMMNAMAERIEYNMAQADKREAALSFVVIVPNAGSDSNDENGDDVVADGDVPPPRRAAAKRFGGLSLKRMTASTRCRLHILLSAKEHGYVEGAQHMRPTRFKSSLYDTSVIVLQSKRARKEQSLDKVLLESKIREAFASRHEAEVEQRKRNRKNSDGADSSSSSQSEG